MKSKELLETYSSRCLITDFLCAYCRETPAQLDQMDFLVMRDYLVCPVLVDAE